MKTSFSGRNIDVAVKNAAKAMGVEPDDLNYEVLAGAAGGFALIKVVTGEAKGPTPAAELVENVSGDLIDEESGELKAAPERDDDRGGRDRGGRGGRDRGGRGGRDRGGRDDRRGGGRGRGGRGDRDDKRGGGRSRRPRRGRDVELPDVPADGPTAVAIQVEGELSEIGEDAHEVLRDILSGMGFGMNVEMLEEGDQIRFDLDSDAYHDVLVANNLEVLDAIEHLVDKIVNFDAEDRKRITVDARGTKAKSDLHLGETARTMADKALETGNTVKLGPLDPRSRRIVHVALRDVKGVTTRSEGEGAFRRVCIIPKG